MNTLFDIDQKCYFVETTQQSKIPLAIKSFIIKVITIKKDSILYLDENGYSIKESDLHSTLDSAIELFKKLEKN